MLELLDSILSQLLSALPLIAAALATWIVTLVRRHTNDVIPPELYPLLLPIAGAVVAGIAKGVGFDVGDFNASTANFSMWETVVAGALTGGGAVWIHEARRSVRRLREDPLDEEDYVA